MLKDLFLGRFRKLCENFLDIVEKRLIITSYWEMISALIKLKGAGLKSTLGKMVEDRTFS